MATAPDPTRPFASKAQREKWIQLLQEGRVTQEQFDARENASKGLELPDRATPRKPSVGASRGFDATKKPMY